MALFGGKKSSFRKEDFVRTLKSGDHKKAYEMLAESKPEDLADDNEVLFSFIGLKYLATKEMFSGKLKVGNLDDLEEAWEFSGEIERFLGLMIYRFSLDPKYLPRLVDYLELLGRCEDAIALINKTNPKITDPELLNKLGFLNWELKDYRAALDCFKKSLVYASNPIIYNSMALIYNELGNQVLAKKYFAEGLKSFPDDITLLTNYGVLLFNLGEYEASNNIVSKLKKYNVGTNFLHAGIGKILPPEYEIDLETELKRHPKNPGIVLEIAKYYLRRGDLGKLIDFIVAEVKNGNDSPKISTILSYAYYYNFQFSEAENTIIRSLGKYSNDITLLLALIFLYIHMGKLANVIPVLEKIKTVDPMYIESLFNVAMILEGANIFTKAKLLYDWYVKVSDNSSGKFVASLKLEIIDSKLKVRKEEKHNETIF